MTATLSASGLIFDAAAHEYYGPDGQRIPGVTEILGAVGVSVDFEGLSAGSSRLADAIELKREIGHATHADCHSFDDDDLDFATVDLRVLPYLAAWQAFRENSRVQPTTRERRVWHTILGYAGTLDGIFALPNGRSVLIDIKTGDPASAAAHLQTAAYAAAYLFEHPSETIHERWSVQLTPDLRVPYRITPYADWRDFPKFKACLTVFGEQPARLRRAA